jgi:hypothetical protein
MRFTRITYFLSQGFQYLNSYIKFRDFAKMSKDFVFHPSFEITKRTVIFPTERGAHISLS